MKIGVIADDFTGASDIALTLAEAGMSVAQFIGTPDHPATARLDAGVVALKSRTAPVTEAVATSLAACNWLLEQGAGQIVFKVCSTFDSTDDGNIGPVLDALLDRLGADRAMVCPAFPENGRSVYQGHLFVNDVLLNASGMQDHPLTPMKDPDLRRVLARQSTHRVGHVPAPTVMKGADAITAALPEAGHVILDAISDIDLMEIGRAAAGEKLLCGGSGIALGLPANFGCTPGAPGWSPVSGPGVVLSGSCSHATQAQVDAYQSVAPHWEITAADILQGNISASTVADWVMAQPVAPLVFSSASAETVRRAQQQHGRDTVAQGIETFFADMSGLLVARGIRRMVVAGGETSGAVVGGLGATALTIGPRLAAGVPVTRIESDPPIALALKSGNFGKTDFFASALAFMEGST